MKILLGVTGSIAATLTPKIIDAIVGRNHEVKVIMTASALEIIGFSSSGYYEDKDEWKVYWENSSCLHVDLAKWCDRMLIAPCTANTVAKMVGGFSDNLLMCTYSVVQGSGKPITIAPAMNTHMFHSTAVQRNLGTLYRNEGISIAKPVRKVLYCGDDGLGAMADIKDILDILERPFSAFDKQLTFGKHSHV